LLRWAIRAFVVVVGRGGAVGDAAASHRLGDSNPAVRAPACWSRSNFLLLGNDDDNVTFSADSRPRRLIVRLLWRLHRANCWVSEL
jgi:hypothetical protein